MPREITKTIYTFAELLELEKQGKVTAKAVERAREWLREGATAFDWWEYVYTDYQRALEAAGFEGVEIQFSGFWSQGDGACFTARTIDEAKLISFLANPPAETNCYDETDTVSLLGWLRYKAKGGIHYYERFGKLLLISDYIRITVHRTNHRYSHPYTCRLEVETPELYPDSRYPKLTDLVNDFAETAEDFRISISQAIYNDLSEEYDARVSDECLAEDAEANEYTFDADGVREG